MRSILSGASAVLAVLLALAIAPAARAGEAAPPTPPVAADAPPPPPPGPGTTDPAPVEAGSAAGLYAPTLEERACAADRCLRGIPEVRVFLYDPTARFQIPYTGGYNPRNREWNVFAGETLTYDSNIYAAQHGVESDWISNTSVGGTYRREGAAFWALATLSLTYSAYFDHTEENALNAYGNFEFGWKGAALYASISDQVGYLQNPIVIRDNTFLIVDQSLDSYWINTLKARVGYECARWRAELGYTSDLFNANSSVIQDYNHHENDLTGRFDYYVSEKTSVGAYVGGGLVYYSSGTQSDYDTWRTGVTFSWRPLAKFGLVGSLGNAWLNSDSGSDYSELEGSLDIAYDPGVNVSTFLGWQRSFQPSLGADAQVVDIIRLRAQGQLAGCWGVNASTGVQFGDNLNSTLDGAKDYSLFFFDAMIHRPLGDHWAVDGGYQFRKQNSDSNGIDYDQHRVTVGVTFSF